MISIAFSSFATHNTGLLVQDAPYLGPFSRSQFVRVLCQALTIDTLPEDLQNAADLVHDHCVVCVKSSRPVPRPQVVLPSVHQPGVCASVDYRYIHHPSRSKALRVLIMAEDFSGRVSPLLWTARPSLRSEQLQHS
jgi:hypothetical protein